MTRQDALDLIDDIRDTLSHEDGDTNMLVSIIRDLHDGYELEDVVDAARKLRLSNYDAEQEIKRIVRMIAE